MSNHRNHRRGEERRTEHGPSWENPDPGKGCNSTHVARARRKWKKHANRSFRRTGFASKVMVYLHQRIDKSKLPEEG